jgi:hypothetical protein
MASIVKGHGADTDGEDIFIPDGVVVRMYTAEAVDLRTSVALLAMLDECGDPGVAITGTIKNYTLYTQDDRFIAQWYALSGESSLPIWWVGTDIPDGTRLCEDPNRNSDDPEAVTCRGQGAHTCSGVLGLVQDSDIRIVACRGSWVEDESDVVTPTSYDTSADGIAALVTGYLAELESGDMARVRQAEVDIDTIPQEIMAVMIVRISFTNWQKARWTYEYAAANDLEQMFGQLRSNSANLPGIMEWLDKIPHYGAAVDAVAQAYPEQFVGWLNHYQDDSVRQALLGRPALAQVLEDVSLSGVAELYQ